MRLAALGGRQVRQDGIERGIMRSLVDEHAGHRELARGGCMYQVHLHRVVLSLDRVLAGGMEMILDQLELLIADGQDVAVGVVDLNRVAVVDPVGHMRGVDDPERRGWELRLHLREVGANRLIDIDRRLVLSVTTGRPFGAQRATFARLAECHDEQRRRREVAEHEQPAAAVVTAATSWEPSRRDASMPPCHRAGVSARRDV